MNSKSKKLKPNITNFIISARHRAIKKIGNLCKTSHLIFLNGKNKYVYANI